MLHVVLDVDFLIKMLTDDQSQHGLHAAHADQMLSHTVTAVFAGTGERRGKDRQIVGKKNTDLVGKSRMRKRDMRHLVRNDELDAFQIVMFQIRHLEKIRKEYYVLSSQNECRKGVHDAVFLGQIYLRGLL